MTETPHDPEQHPAPTAQRSTFSRRQALRGLAGTAVGLGAFGILTRDIGAASPRRGPSRPTSDKPTTTTTSMSTTSTIETTTTSSSSSTSGPSGPTGESGPTGDTGATGVTGTP